MGWRGRKGVGLCDWHIVHLQNKGVGLCYYHKIDDSCWWPLNGRKWNVCRQAGTSVLWQVEDGRMGL